MMLTPLCTGDQTNDLREVIITEIHGEQAVLDNWTVGIGGGSGDGG